MVTVLPARESFGAALGKALGGAAQSTAEGYSERKRKEKEMSSQNDALKKMGIDLSGITDPEIRKLVIAEELKGNRKLREKEAENKEAQAGIMESADWLDKNLKYSGTFGVHQKWGGVEAQGEGGGLGLRDESGKQLSNMEIKAKREGIDQTGLWLADKVYTHFNKGVINQTKWEDVKDRFAANSELPAAINRERVAAVKRIMGLPTNAPASVINKVIDTEMKTLDKIEKSKGGKSKELKLTDDIINSILDETKGDVKKAEQIAKERGYSW